MTPQYALPSGVLSPFGVVGFFTTLYILAKSVHQASIYLRPSRLSRYIHPSPDGKPPWALVTGATSGTGLAFARELCSHGFNVVLHERDPENLARVMRQLQNEFPQRSFRMIAADATTVPCANCLGPALRSSHEDEDVETVDFAEIQSALDDLNLTVLVNNVGGNRLNPLHLSVSDTSEERMTENISLNALFPVHLTRTLLPTLIRSSPALVINISSMADMGFPMLASYGASKRFLMTFTRSLSLEMEGNDVEVLGIRLGRVSGTTFIRDPPSFSSPSADETAKAALAKAGHGHGIVVGHWAHALQQLATDLMPAWLGDRIFKTFAREQMRAEAKRL